MPSPRVGATRTKIKSFNSVINTLFTRQFVKIRLNSTIAQTTRRVTLNLTKYKKNNTELQVIICRTSKWTCGVIKKSDGRIDMVGCWMCWSTPHPTQYKPFQRRSSQPITWLILTNKTVQNRIYTNYIQLKQCKIQHNKTTLVQSPLTTLCQETRWAYSTMFPRPHGARRSGRPGWGEVQTFPNKQSLERVILRCTFKLVQ